MMTSSLLDLYSDYLLCSFGQTTATGLAALLPDQISHDQVTRMLSRNTFDQKTLWKVVKPHIRACESPQGVLILDDSVEEKLYTDENEIICWHFDHCLGRSVKGINLLSCVYHSNQMTLPLDFEIITKTKWEVDPKTGKGKFVSEVTKNDLARAMILRAKDKQILFQYVLMDTWFAAADTLVFIKTKVKKDFITALKSNRRVATSLEAKKSGKWERLDQLHFESGCPKTIYLESVEFAILVHRQVFNNEDGSEGILYLVTSDLSLTSGKIETIYQTRWKVEEYHKSLKSNASFSKSPTKKVRTQSNHLFASLVAYVKLEVCKSRCHINHFALRARLYREALNAAFSGWQELRQSGLAPAITL